MAENTTVTTDAKLAGVEKQIKQIAHLLETTKRSEDILKQELKTVKEKQDKVDRLLQIGAGIGQTSLDKTSPTTGLPLNQRFPISKTQQPNLFDLKNPAITGFMIARCVYNASKIKAVLHL